MFNYLKLFFNILKSVIKPVIKGIYGNRYYHGVDFFNTKNINIKSTSVIERGTRLWAVQPQGSINIIIENNCWIGRDVEIHTSYNSKIVLNNNVSVQDRCKILGDVFIGQNSLLAPDVFLSSGNHYYNIKPTLLIKEQDKLVINNAEDFKMNSKRILIGEDCWIGKGVITQSGVNVGRGSIIAANSFVKTNIPPYEVWGGVPAKFLKKRFEFAPPNSLDYVDENHWPYFYMGFNHTNVSEGFLSDNLSVCVLKQNSKCVSIYLEGDMRGPGGLKIWFNNILIFDKEVCIGILNENINIDYSNSSNAVNPDYYALLTEESKLYNLISFSFLPKSSAISQGFSIRKISQND